MAIIKVRWTVSELANVMTLFNEQKVYRSSSGPGGPYAEITGVGSRVTLVAGVESYLYDDSTGSVDAWYRVSYYQSMSGAESELSDPIAARGGGSYVTIQDLRDEGVTEAMATDARLMRLIEAAEAYIERITGRWFYPKQLTIRQDGEDSRIVQLGCPIIKVESVKYLYELVTGAMVTSEIGLDSLRVYNRHLTQGYVTEDDREAPRIALETYFASRYIGSPHFDRLVFPRGRQNIIVAGWFGYTELLPGMPVGETSEGSQVPLSYGGTPPAIKDCALRLVIRSAPQLNDADAIEELRRPFIQTMTTRDQSITFGGGRNGAGVRTGAFTGDPMIDDTLAAYMRPAQESMV